MRDVYTDPRPGDVGQVVPTVSYRFPEPMQVIDVSDFGVRWRRPVSGQHITSPWSVWNSRGSTGCKRALELVEVKLARHEDQIDLFGEVPAS